MTLDKAPEPSTERTSKTESTIVALPLYRQVKTVLVDRIANGEWKPGSVLPAEPKIASELGVSPGTVRKALDDMVAERLVHRRQGIGTFVTSATDRSRLFYFNKICNAERRRIVPNAHELAREVSSATSEERRILDLARGQRVIRIKRVRSTSGHNMMNETIVLPYRRFAALANDPGELPDTLYDLYEARFGVSIRSVTEHLRAVAADDEDTKTLDVERGEPLLEIERRAFTFEKQPVERRIFRLGCREFGYLNEME